MTAPSRSSAVWLAVAAALAAVPACKRMERSARPPVTSIDEAERALNDNAARLAGFGIVPSTPAGAAEQAPLGFAQDEQDTATAEAQAGAPGEGGEASRDSGMAPALELEPSVATAPPTDPPAPTSEPVSDRQASAKDKADARTGRCTRICDVAESTCDLAQQICDLAAGHPGQPRYDQACTRATEQCRAASAACDRCE